MSENTTEPGTTTKERFLLQKRMPNGDLRFLEAADSLEEVVSLRDWWASDSADPEAYKRRLRIVRETTAVTYTEVEA